MTGSSDAEVTFFQQLDLRKQEQAHDLELAKVRADAQVKIERQKTRQQLISWLRNSEVLQWFGWIGGVVVAVAIISWAVWGIHHLATSDPPKSPEQIQLEQKQERFKRCIKFNGNDDGAHDNVWYPTAEGGQGLCLPKDKPAPTTP